MSKLSHLKQWLLEKRYFSTSWFDKGPQAKPKEEEALTQLPNDVSDSLLATVNELPTPPCEQEAVLKAVNKAIARWQKNPQRSTASVVILAHPVSSIARILSDCLSDPSFDSLEDLLQAKSKEAKSKEAKSKEAESKEAKLEEGESRATSLTVRLLDWVQRPTNVEEIKEKIRQKLGWEEEDFPAADGSGYETRAEKDADNSRSEQANDAAKTADNEPLTLAVIPNLGWCFLRSADGLDGIDYLQELLLDDHHQFWIIGSGKVGWEYLHSTLKLGAYCGETITMPKLSGEQIQSWLQPVVEQFDVQFSDRAFRHRLQSSEGTFHQGVSLEGLSELKAKVSQEVSSTVQSSLQTIKEEIQGEDDQTDSDESPKKHYFNRLADISEGVSIVALQLFVQSLRYRKVDPKADQTEPGDKPQKEHTGQEKGNRQLVDSDSFDSQQSDSQQSGDNQTPDAQASKPQLIATFPKLPPLPDLDQGELYLLYSLMLHGDLTVRALAKSLGDPPQVVSNQLQVLRSDQVVEQKDGVVKINPVHYPNLRKELLRNNFIIKVD